nr:SidA/IucD/PvdA family monooxygenase [uncultured Flavobacterium sp.]
MSDTKTREYDMIGIGYGPANISLNICINEELEKNKEKITYHFFDKKKVFDWHSDMMIPGSNMQISFLKDLVTQRNPRSKYTFINFLFETNRLEKFINLRRFEPYRIEFEEYLKWVTQHFKDDIAFNSIVNRIEPIIDKKGCVNTLKVYITDLFTGKVNSYCTKNIVIAVSNTPNLINYTQHSDRVIHSTNFLNSLSKIKVSTNKVNKIAVVGSGQSAIEMLIYLYDKYPDVIIDVIFPDFAIRQSDASLFVNEIFSNKNVDDFYYGNSYTRKKLFMGDTNYNVVDNNEIEKLYNIHYLESFHKSKRLFFKNYSKVKMIDVKEDTAELLIHNLNTEKDYLSNYDYVFLGTGFIKNKLEFLEPIKEFLVTEDGNYKVNRDYSLKSKINFNPRVYVQGHSEDQHGISNTLLSINSLRSQEITNSLMSCIRENATCEYENKEFNFND